MPPNAIRSGTISTRRPTVSLALNDPAQLHRCRVTNRLRGVVAERQVLERGESLGFLDSCCHRSHIREPATVVLLFVRSVRDNDQRFLGGITADCSRAACEDVDDSLMVVECGGHPHGHRRIDGSRSVDCGRHGCRVQQLRCLRVRGSSSRSWPVPPVPQGAVPVSTRST